MKLIFLFKLLILFTSLSAHAEHELCSAAIFSGDKAIYKYSVAPSACPSRNDCWLLIDPPEDVINVRLGDEPIFDFLSGKIFIKSEVFLIPLRTISLDSSLVITAQDINQDISFKENLCVLTGSYSSLRWKSAFRWFVKTGATLFSAYFLIMVSILLTFSVWLRTSGPGISLLAYSIISTFYLISFSEYPRAILDPILATGAFHFPLRLLQDLALVMVFKNFYQTNDQSKVIGRLAYVYIGVILVYFVLLLIGVRDYLYYSRIIILFAPLVAAPMAIGAWFSFKLQDPIERKILVPVSILLFAFQLNDLFVFWKVLNGYFTVKFYIPFIVGMCLFLYFRRIYKVSIKNHLSFEREKIINSFIHDVKSPLAVLKIFLAGKNGNIEHHQVVASALNRIEGMIYQVGSTELSLDTDKIFLPQALAEILDQKRVELPSLNIKLDVVPEVSIIGNVEAIQRVVSNLVNNAYEAYEFGEKRLEVKIIPSNDNVRILFIDYGKGIPKNIQSEIDKGNIISSKEGGRGLGLGSAQEYLTKIGGKLSFYSKEGYGTTVELILNTALNEVVAEDMNLKNNDGSFKTANIDYVLIDDDKYIRLSWSYFAKNSNKNILTYSTVEEFLKDKHLINKECSIYLDVNINGKKSIDRISDIVDSGFENIFLATGERMDSSELPEHIKGISGKLPPIH